MGGGALNAEVRVECSGLGGGLDMDGGVVVMGWASWVWGRLGEGKGWCLTQFDRG